MKTKEHALKAVWCEG